MSYLVPSGQFLIEISKGNVPGHALVHKFGRNPSVDTTSDPEDVWAAGGTMNWPTAAAVVSVVSTDANDDGNPTTNTGAQTIAIEGLNGSFVEASETVTLDGTNPVTTSGSFIRVNRAYVATVGTYHGANIGTISGTIGGSSMMSIEAGAGQTQLGRYTVPASKTGYLLGGFISVDSTKTATVSAFQMPNADDTSQPYSGAKRLVAEFDGVQGEEIFEYKMPLVLAANTDFWFEVTSVTANGTAVDVDFEILLVDD